MASERPDRGHPRHGLFEVRPGPHRLRLSNASLNRNVNGATAAFPLFAGRVDAQIMDVHVLPTGQVDYMKINNVDIKHIEEKSVTTTKTHQIGLTLKHDFTDRLSADFKLGHSGSDFKQPWDVLMSYDGFNKAGLCLGCPPTACAARSSTTATTSPTRPTSPSPTPARA
jgi:hypothetical protein